MTGTRQYYKYVADVRPTVGFTMSSGTGNYGGTVNDVWSYGGGGPISDTNANNEDLNGSITEGESNTLSVSYSIAANWSSNAWQYSGNATGISLDAGQWTSSATGTYQNDETDSQRNTVEVDGSMGVTSIVNWGYNGTVTLNPNATGSLTMTTGGGNWTGDNQADWSYSGSGSYNDDDTDSGISEGENNSNYTTYSIQATWNPAGQTYSYSGNQTQTSLDSGSWASTINNIGDYNPSISDPNVLGGCMTGNTTVVKLIKTD